jgi:hypothetical protein
MSSTPTDNTPVASIIVPMFGSPIQELRCFVGLAAKAEFRLYEFILL